MSGKRRECQSRPPGKPTPAVLLGVSRVPRWVRPRRSHRSDERGRAGRRRCHRSRERRGAARSQTLLWATRNPPSRERTRHRPGLTRHKTRDGKRVELSWYPWTAGDASDGRDNITDVTGVPVPTYPTDPKRMVAGQGSRDGSPSPVTPGAKLTTVTYSPSAGGTPHLQVLTRE
jgi:hypothetical protein